MEEIPYKIIFSGLVSEQLMKLDGSARQRILRRIERMGYEPVGRHLRHGLDFFVVEIGQYRVVYKAKNATKTIFFVGTHKEYEKWFRSTND